MLHTPDVTPHKPLSNTTNVLPQDRGHPIFTALPTPPQDVGCKRRMVAEPHETPTKKARITAAQVMEFADEDSDVDMEVNNGRMRRHAMLGLLSARSVRPPIISASTIRGPLSSYPAIICIIKQIRRAKRNGTPLLAVATEEGSVMIMNTSKRRDWDFEPQRTLLQPHYNGIFDVKWSPDDSAVATASGDKTTHITSVETQQLLHVLRGHSSTVKRIAWNPSHSHLLTTGSRDGNIYLWDLRVSDNSDLSTSMEEDTPPSSPVMVIDSAHGKEKIKGGRKKAVPLPRSVTGVIYTSEHTLVSSGSYNGILNMWDLRQPKVNATGRQTKKSVAITPICISPEDPTMLHGARRPRGLMTLCAGSGPTGGLLFALGADNRVHTFDSSSLTPVESITHPNLSTSFYVHLASSPCGRWLASGCAGKNGSLFLYDVSNAGRVSASSHTRAFNQSLSVPVELRGQTGEIGAVDWANDTVAACADDRTVRVWRPDLDVYQDCTSQPEEKQWDWSWSRQVYPS
ncbi:hypothetical protein ID866_10797 [Astraeus odoratus]|nr:hypothetical protein ID866_10797 [Astraeus odoratus]